MDREIFEPEKADRTQAENDFFETDKEENPFDPFLKKAGSDPTESREKDFARDQHSAFMSSFLVELVHSIKNTLTSINKTSSLSADRFNDAEFRKHAQQSVTEDIKRIDSVLNTLLNYIHIDTPIIKSNTISLILEGVLEVNEKEIERKNIKIFKKCEKDLPETLIHDQQMNFILNSILQYAILSTPLDGTIGLLIKSFDFHRGEPDKKISPERKEGYIEAAIGFVGSTDSAGHSKDNLPISGIENEETTKLILPLVREILQKNRGSMTHDVDPKKPRTLIILRFPIERRKVVYYEPISI